MASIRKVGKKWKVEVRRKGKSRTARFNSKSEAVAWASEVERLILGGTREYSKAITFKDACDKYEKEVSLKKKGARWESIRIRKLLESLGENSLAELDSRFWRYWSAKRQESVSPSSVNRELNLISAIFSQCVDWEYLESNPIKGLKRPKSPKHRDRRISDSEIKKITKHLGTNPKTSSGQTSLAFLLALETGMRRGEILGLKWKTISLDKRFLKIVDSKNSDSREVPLSSRAIELLRELEGDQVFTVTPETLSTLFRRACNDLEIEGLTFHDSRHEAVSRLARKLDVLSLAKMIGHRDVKNLMIYYNPTASELADLLD